MGSATTLVAVRPVPLRGSITNTGRKEVALMAYTVKRMIVAWVRQLMVGKRVSVRPPAPVAGPRFFTRPG